MVNCDILEVTADRELEQNIWRFVQNRYLKVLAFRSFKFNIFMFSLIWHLIYKLDNWIYSTGVHWIFSLTYNLDVYSRNCLLARILFSLNWKPDISVKLVLSFRHIVTQFVALTTCKLFITVQAHTSVCLFQFPHLSAKNISPWNVAPIYFFEKESQGQYFLNKIFCWQQLIFYLD